MKVAILTDTHSGTRNDSDYFTEVQSDFYDHCFFPVCMEKKVEAVIHVGDMMDKRKSTNSKSLYALKRHFIDRILFYELDFHIVLGNHDFFFKNTKTVSSVKEIFGKHVGERFHIYDTPKTITLGTKEILLIPWIIPDEMDDLGAILEQNTAKMCIGHFEMNGVLMQKGVMATHGIDPDMFSKFECVLSGHYHTHSVTVNITYIGSPFQMTFADLDDRKCFAIYDTETDEIEWIYNDNNVFLSYSYDGSEDVDEFDFEQFRNKNLKLIVTGKDDVKKYNKFVKKVDEVNPYSFIVIDKYLYTDVTNAEDVDIEQDTLEVLIETTEQMEIPDEWKPPIKGILVGLYEEANSF